MDDEQFIPLMQALKGIQDALEQIVETLNEFLDEDEEEG